MGRLQVYTEDLRTIENADLSQTTFIGLLSKTRLLVI